MFFLAGAVLAIAALAAWAGSSVNHGFALADRFCSNASVLCDNPRWLMAAALAFGLIAIYRASVRQ